MIGRLNRMNMAPSSLEAEKATRSDPMIDHVTQNEETTGLISITSKKASHVRARYRVSTLTFVASDIEFTGFLMGRAPIPACIPLDGGFLAFVLNRDVRV